VIHSGLPARRAAGQHGRRLNRCAAPSPARGSGSAWLVRQPGLRIRMAFEESHEAPVRRLQRVPPMQADDESAQCEGIRPQGHPDAVRQPQRTATCSNLM
jgi:hypothetical protein